MSDISTWVCASRAAVHAVVVILAVAAVASGLKRCDPADPSTCQFGGTCQPVGSRYDLISFGYSEYEHVCWCSTTSCFQFPKDLICTKHNEGPGELIFNENCKEYKECLRQAPLEIYCKGAPCHHPDCRLVKEPSPETSCNRRNFCLNSGWCRQRKNDPEQKRCICPNGFYGQRCQWKFASIKRQRDDAGRAPVNDSNVNYKLAFLFCLALLGLVLLWVAANIARNLRSYKSLKEKGLCCDGKNERDELRPVSEGRASPAYDGCVGAGFSPQAKTADGAGAGTRVAGAVGGEK